MNNRRGSPPRCFAGPALTAAAAPVTAATLAKGFARANFDDVAEILDTLVALGRARPGDHPGTFVR